MNNLQHFCIGAMHEIVAKTISETFGEDCWKFYLIVEGTSVQIERAL